LNCGVRRFAVAALSLGAAAVLAAPAQAKTVEDIITLPVTVTDMFGKEVTQPITVTIYHDDEKTGQPFLVLNHGRPATPNDFAAMGRVRFAANARYFMSKGFVVLVPTRIGYGVSAGSDVEYSGNCSGKDYRPGFEAAAQQVATVVAHARSLPYVDPARGLVVGQSFGGATTGKIHAGDHARQCALPGVIASVNFSGGGGGNPVDRPGSSCRPDLIAKLYADYGSRSRMPTLWLYSENDRYFGKDAPHGWFDAFIKQGGVGEFVQMPALPAALGDDGHASFTKNPDAWHAPFEAFLTRTGF
jgi:dienelactone hydrolase